MVISKSTSFAAAMVFPESAFGTLRALEFLIRLEIARIQLHHRIHLKAGFRTIPTMSGFVVCLVSLHHAIPLSLAQWPGATRSLNHFPETIAPVNQCRASGEAPNRSSL